MAGAQHNPSRRALLGAAVGVPLIASGDAPPPAFASGYGRSPSPSKLGEDWVRALAAFQAAETALVGVEEAARGWAGYDEALAAEHDRRLAAMYGALRELLAVPAPDLAAFERKIELAIEHQLSFDTGFGGLGFAQDQRMGGQAFAAA